MRSVRVKNLLKDPILVSRESARLLEGAIRASMVEGSHSEPFVVDFEGIAGVAPSFLDELISIFQSVVQADGQQQKPELIVAHPPSRLSLKFEAIARGHGMTVRSLADGSWALNSTG